MILYGWEWRKWNFYEGLLGRRLLRGLRRWGEREHGVDWRN